MEFRNTRGLTRNEQARENERKADLDYSNNWRYEFDKKNHEYGEFKIVNRFKSPQRCKTPEEALEIYNSMSGRTTLFCGTAIIKHKQS